MKFKNSHVIPGTGGMSRVYLKPRSDPASGRQGIAGHTYSPTSSASPPGGGAARHQQPDSPTAVHCLWVFVLQHHENRGDFQGLPTSHQSMYPFYFETL